MVKTLDELSLTLIFRVAVIHGSVLKGFREPGEPFSIALDEQWSLKWSNHQRWSPHGNTRMSHAQQNWCWNLGHSKLNQTDQARRSGLDGFCSDFVRTPQCFWLELLMFQRMRTGRKGGFWPQLRCDRSPVSFEQRTHWLCASWVCESGSVVWDGMRLHARTMYPHLANI